MGAATNGNGFFQEWDEKGAFQVPPPEAPRPRPAAAGADPAGAAAAAGAPRTRLRPLAWPPTIDEETAKVATARTFAPKEPEPDADLAPEPEEADTTTAPKTDTPYRPTRAYLEARGERESGSAGRARELSYDTLVRHRADVPTHGWRRAVYLLSCGAINPGIGPVEAARQALRARVNAPLRAPYRLATVSIKGGSGKTTISACIGSALAEIRGDQVSVIDANPDAGTLADRLTGDNSITIRDLLANIDSVDSLTGVMSYMSLAGRLKVLASDQDPAVSEALTGAEYERALRKLSQYFNIVITDTGTGMTHSTMHPALSLAHRVVVVGGVTIDGASRASQTLDWLQHHGHADKAASAVVVLNRYRRSTNVDTSRIVEHFRDRLRDGGGAVVLIPQDPHLDAGGLIDFSRLRQDTRDAFTEAAAYIADRFPEQRPGG